ncbi:protein FAM149B1-like isoform X2 [Hydractinia symbiolongicarpus]|uniref:protein FAM149B1-like isoform X2 n=1 Tax=Hydractinia symbiolongicarpus TaxID=13093 RepID=UPI00254D60CA|nr:protein FAM149B1-like isoform X2 [Hydractinia symbiolongicarpus]
MTRLVGTEKMLRTSSMNRGSHRYPSLVLHGHGLSKNTFEELRPLPEKPEEPYYPYPHEYNNQDVQSPEESEELSFSTSSSSNTFINGFFNESVSSVGTGGNITTGRSSAYSWGHEDEFDKKASSQVRAMFDEIDCCLFENVSHQMNDECSDWVTSFPYLRLLGNQLIPSEESGIQMISKETGPVGNKVAERNELLEDVETDAGTELSILSVNGQKVEAVNAPASAQTLSKQDISNQFNSLSHLEEEVFAIDGEIEEFIAYDNNDNEKQDPKDRKRKKHRAFPPVTPHAFIKETVLSECFDNVWVEVIGILKHLLKLYIRARAKKEMERQHANFDSNMDRFLESSLELPPSRDSYYGRHPRFPSQLRLKVGTGIFNTSSDLTALKKLITIRSVSLQHRESSVTQNMIPEEDVTLKDPVNHRPLSSTVGVFRQFPKTSTFRAAEQQFYHRMFSAKGPKRAIRLQPLQTPKTAGHVEVNNVGEVRGTRLTTSGGRQAGLTINNNNNQQLWGARNGALPPLERLGAADTTLSYQVKSPKRKNRATSAVSNDSKNPTTRDRSFHSTLPDSRPNTTQSFLNDQSFNRLKLRDSSQSLPSKTSAHTYHDNPFSTKQLLEEEPQEFDDLVLWGHGPPLISHQQPRKRKSLGGGPAR